MLTYKAAVKEIDKIIKFYKIGLLSIQETLNRAEELIDMYIIGLDKPADDETLLMNQDKLYRHLLIRTTDILRKRIKYQHY